jgi:hypothetical protein
MYVRRANFLSRQIECALSCTAGASTLHLHVAAVARLRGPQISESNRERFEGLALHDDLAAPYASDAIAGTIETQDLEGLQQRVNEPNVGDLLPAIDR